MERRHRRTKREKLDDELLKITETMDQYTRSLADLEEKRLALIEEIEQERIREVTRLMKEKNLSVEQLKNIIGETPKEAAVSPGA